METFVKAQLPGPTKTLEGTAYQSRLVFEEERERIFSRSWCAVAREEEIARPGDYLLAEVAGESLIVTRANGAVRAFYNVCRHRGTRLCTERSGRFTGSIQCPYHGWTYAADGSLQVARNMQSVPGFERRDYPLREASVALSDGFVFVNLDRRTDSFEGGLGAIFKRFSRWELAKLRAVDTIAYELACNWKLVFQNYSECYHCPLLHPQLEKLSPSESGRNDLREGPVLGGYSELRANRSSLTTSGETTRPPLAGLSEADLQRVYYYTIFPSMLLSLHPDYAMVHLVKPLAPDRTSVVCSWLFADATIAQTDFDPSDAVGLWDLTNRQDWAVNERTQLGIASRAYEPGPYANEEGLLAAFDRYYRAVMIG